MYSLKALFQYIYAFNLKKFFSKLHFNRVKDTLTRFRERGEFQVPGAQLL